MTISMCYPYEVSLGLFLRHNNGMVGKNREQEFKEMFETSSDAIFRHIYMRVHERELARDLTQDSFTRLWQAMREGKEIENMRAFLYRIAHNIVIDYYRKKKDESLDALTEQGFDPVGETANAFMAGAEFAEFRRALLRIPDNYRDAVTMRYVDEMFPEEIAGILGISPGAVSVRINRGVEMLRKELGINASQHI
ncbi:MAG TPA: RNA polymerase sigma factor [Candidatus Paceibacterota bacterium]